jgi:hypothetical protein
MPNSNPKKKIPSELEKVVGTHKYSVSRANEHQDLMQKGKEFQRPMNI